MLKRFSTLMMLWALASCFAFANAPNVSKFAPDISANPIDGCDLLPPLDFHVEDIGSTWVKLKWTPVVPGLYDHRVKTYKVAGNVLVSNVVVPANQNSVTVNGLTPGELYYSTINVICPDGSDSKYFSQSAQYRAIITDLIVTGFNPTNLNPTCGINEYGEFCEFSTTGFENFFKVYKINNPYSNRQFTVYKNFSSNTLRAKVSSVDGEYQFWIDDKQPDQYGVKGTHFHIFGNNGTMWVGSFQMYYHYNGSQEVGHLICEGIHPDYVIVRLTPGPPPPEFKQGSSTFQEDTENREAAPKAALPFSANPNPFSEILEVTLGENTQGPIHLQLLNLSGQVVIDRREMPGLEQVTLPTDHLANGFYMLRIEAAGEVQTIKVVKSE